MRAPNAHGSADAPEQSSEPFFSGPLGTEERERLLEAIDRRLRFRAEERQARDGADRSEHPSRVEVEVPPGSLNDISAPLFNEHLGGAAGRAARALLNIPLRLFGRPQTYFNDEIRHLLASWRTAFGCSLVRQAESERRIEAHARQLERLARRGLELEYAVAALRRLLPEEERPATRPREPGRYYRIGSGPTVALDYERRGRGRVEVRAGADESVRVTADPAAPPFATGSIAELQVRHVMERYAEREAAERLLPRWRSLLAPGGVLRMMCCDWEAALELYRAGSIDAQRLHAISFGSPSSADHRAMYTRAALVVLLEAAGFVDCSITLLPGTSESCPEMEVAGVRPAE
jgi:hypothetical protein